MMIAKDDDPHILNLRKRGLLVHVDKTDEEIARDTIRASGMCICEKCGKEYWWHPYVDNCRDMDGYPFVHITCDGTIVKL